MDSDQVKKEDLVLQWYLEVVGKQQKERYNLRGLTVLPFFGYCTKDDKRTFLLSLMMVCWPLMLGGKIK